MASVTPSTSEAFLAGAQTDGGATSTELMHRFIVVLRPLILGSALFLTFTVAWMIASATTISV